MDFKTLTQKINDFKKSKPLIYFIVLFTVTFTVIYTFSYSFDEAYTKFYINRGNSYFDSAINKDYEYNRRVNITQREKSATSIHLQIVYLDKKNPNGTLIAKDIYTNLRTEALIPTIFMLSLIIATPLRFKKKMWALATGFVLIHIYIFFKLYTFAYDNYTHPEFNLIDLPPVISQIVYGANFFFEMTGASTVVIIPVIFWLISCRGEELMNLINVNKNFKTV